ncbi:hypothetical protein CRG98_015393 [Punica granatum]|uniref:FAS1 domain-containing protein n=1 Tax=Punica granatum TaxID=22663 RepID=A0A2I0K909_PUNGR|nr:hypothetical protein CRG98_015393 [Punica granatum]
MYGAENAGLAQTIAGPPSFSPTPAPAPAPDFVNLTDLFSVAGPFHTFLSYLQSTKVIDTFQNQANDTEEGITIFVPKDSAFSSLKKPSLSNLTEDQLRSLCLFHAMPHYYTLADFKNLTDLSPGTIHLSSGLTNTKVSSSVHSTDPVAVYQIDKILLPEAIFGTDILVSDAPAPAPDITPVADSPTDATTGGHSTSSMNTSSSPRTASWSQWSRLLWAVPYGMMMLVM